MRFLKTIFWVVLAVGVVLFARENWVPVEIKLWSGLIAEVKLPFLLFVIFLAGFLPTYLLYRGRMWTLRRQIGRQDRAPVGNQPVTIAPPPEMPPLTASSLLGEEAPRPTDAPTAPALSRRSNAPGLST